MKSRLLQNISYAISANIISLGISLVLSFFIPKILGVEEYGYWQLYSLIISYAGFFHLGMIDGIYLKLGGKEYGEVDEKLYHRVFWLFAGFVGCGAAAALLSFGLLGLQEDTMTVYTGAVAAVCLVLVYTYFDMIMQATNRIRESSRLMIAFKISYFILVVSAFGAGFRSYKSMITADILSKCVVAGLAVKCCWNIFFGKAKRRTGRDRVGPALGEITSAISSGIREMAQDTGTGINLMLANVAGMLVTGITRFFIVGYWDIETFGNISIAMTIANLLFAFMSTLSVVFFPVLKRMTRQRTMEIYIPMRVSMSAVLFVLMAFYYPMNLVFSWWLPQYSMGLKYMALLFPMVIFESKSTLILNTYLKAENMEKCIFKANVLSVGVCAMLSYLFSHICHNLVLNVVSVVVVLGVKSLLLERYLMKKLGMKYGKMNGAEAALSGLFILITWNRPYIGGTLIYLIVLGMVYGLSYRKINESVKSFLSIFRERI